MRQLFSKFLVAFLLTSAVVLSWSEYFLVYNANRCPRKSNIWAFLICFYSSQTLIERAVVLNFKMGVSNPNHIWRILKKMVHIVWVVSLLKCDAIAVKSTRVWLPYKFLMCARKSQLFRLKVEKKSVFQY